jgi:hypothetical protein
MIFCAPHRQYGHDFKSRLMQLKPRLYFDMNEASGSTLVNRGSIGISFNATITGTPTYQAAPLVRDNGFAMTFSGSANRAATPNSASIGDALGVHTIGAWIAWTSTTAAITPLSLRSSASGVSTNAPLVIICNHTATGKITLQGFGSNSVTTSGSSYNDGNPHLVIGAINSAGTAALLWVDGVAIGSGALGSRAASNLALGMGANVSNTPVQHFPGTIDNAFHIPFITFTDAMALALYNAGIR